MFICGRRITTVIAIFAGIMDLHVAIDVVSMKQENPAQINLGLHENKAADVPQIKPGAPTETDRLLKLKDDIAKTLACYRNPGLSVSIVKSHLIENEEAKVITTGVHVKYRRRRYPCCVVI